MDAPYAHVACCLDGTPESLAALAQARRLQPQGAGGRLRLVHVFHQPPLYGGLWAPDLGGLQERAQAWLAEQAATVPWAEAVLLEGGPAGATCSWAEEEGVDLLVAATHHGPAHRAVLGSFTHHLLHHAPCPVLVVRTG